MRNASPLIALNTIRQIAQHHREFHHKLLGPVYDDGPFVVFKRDQDEDIGVRDFRRQRRRLLQAGPRPDHHFMDFH